MYIDMHFWLTVGYDGDIVSHTYTVAYGDTHCDVACESWIYHMCASYIHCFMIGMFGYWWIWLPWK